MFVRRQEIETKRPLRCEQVSGYFFFNLLRPIVVFSIILKPNGAFPGFIDWIGRAKRLDSIWLRFLSQGEGGDSCGFFPGARNLFTKG